MKNIKSKQSSDSSSELVYKYKFKVVITKQSINNNSEQDSSSFVIQKRKKMKKNLSKQMQFIETSPNMRYSRVKIFKIIQYEDKKLSEKNHTAYSGIDHDRGCDVTWNVINIANFNEKQKDNLLYELTKLKELKHENINSIADIWKKDDNNIIFITDSFVGGSIRQ